MEYELEALKSGYSRGILRCFVVRVIEVITTFG
jgi:hypothetical protein